MTDNNNNGSAPNALPCGYRFNELEIKSVIGHGGFGIVYRAWDHQLERTIAIKEFMPAALATRDAQLRLVLRNERFSKAYAAGLNSFIQEARLLAHFNHPNLLHVLRFWIQNDTAYMATLYYRGVTLARLAEQQPARINEAWLRHLLPMLLGAVKTLHDAGCLHRDISLDNIQIQDNGLPVLLDFGSARRAIGNCDDETETMLRPGFAPLEQYTDEKGSEQGPWTDIYALGAVLHTLIVGEPPPVSVARSIEDHYQPLAERRPPGYSLPLLQAIDQALALRTEDRPQSIAAFAARLAVPVADIDAVVSGAASPSGAPPVQTSVSTPSDRPPRWLIPTLIAVGALAGIVIGYGLNRTAPPPAVSAATEIPASSAALTAITDSARAAGAGQRSVTSAPVSPTAQNKVVLATAETRNPAARASQTVLPPALAVAAEEAAERPAPSAAERKAGADAVSLTPAVDGNGVTAAAPGAPQTTQTAAVPPALLPAAESRASADTGGKVEASSAPASVAAPIARVYVRLRKGEQLRVNDEPPSTVTSAPAGFAALMLPPGRYVFTLTHDDQTRRQTLEIRQPGTWFIDPQP